MSSIKINLFGNNLSKPPLVFLNLKFFNMRGHRGLVGLFVNRLHTVPRVEGSNPGLSLSFIRIICELSRSLSPLSSLQSLSRLFGCTMTMYYAWWRKGKKPRPANWRRRTGRRFRSGLRDTRKDELVRFEDN